MQAWMFSCGDLYYCMTFNEIHTSIDKWVLKGKKKEKCVSIKCMFTNKSTTFMFIVKRTQNRVSQKRTGSANLLYKFYNGNH